MSFVRFALIVVLLLTLGHVSVYAQTAAELQSQIEAHDKQIKALQAEIAAYQKQLTTLGEQRNTLQSTINTLTVSQKQLAAEISITQTKISSANLELQRLTSEIGDKESTIELSQDTIAKALREVAQGDQQSVIEQIISSGSLPEAWQRAAEVSQFNKALGDHVVELRNVKEELTVDRDEVTVTKAKLVSLQDDLTVQKKSVDLNKVAQQKLLKDTKNQESTYQKLLAEKQAEEKAFEAALFELASQLEYVLDPSKVPPAGQGVLRWPLDNVYITQQFGKTSSSVRLYTSGTHDGVDFRASIGTPVRAARGGTVAEVNFGAVQNCQYGMWVLVRHSNGLSTLYAHLSNISVQKGQSVTMGQVIGYAGSTGYATGPHLHFSVFLADAVKFTQYRCRNGQSVLIPYAATNAYLNPLSYL